ncbi:hypothetical protein AXG93_4280s1260 [Marchantia polymorpha subsp. ruderalis]|uniref:Leucine-rich repeat-containing N-terminal plant-type domain-containing protein n=1 Tax=Marchantia polymorpha subsp. ruderalis TaxID=1480154 RepID=A0A176WNN1_MARPO|nr:hypothetical protein AXG93_4280s1260 [Marchantia polymorpha subsp. ruderalis]
MSPEFRTGGEIALPILLAVRSGIWPFVTAVDRSGLALLAAVRGAQDRSCDFVDGTEPFPSSLHVLRVNSRSKSTMIIVWKIIVATLTLTLHCSTFASADRLPPTTAALQSQSEALLSFKNALADPKALESWNGWSPCSGKWKGITCSADKSSVVKMSLQGSQFFGPIPAVSHCSTPPFSFTPCTKEIQNVNFLESFVVMNTAFSGQIPTTIENLKRLKTLIISKNPLLSGEFPEGIFNLKNIQILDLSWNNLTGLLPGAPPLPTNWSDLFPPVGAQPTYPWLWNSTTSMPPWDPLNLTAMNWSKPLFPNM